MVSAQTTSGGAVIQPACNKRAANNYKARHAMPRTRIVAVDDDRRILRILKHACECVGFKVHTVLDANFFESAFRGFEPALVFLDLNMRNIDGIELLRFIAEERPGTSVVVTSGVDQRLLNAARNLGTSLGLDMLEPISKPLMVADIRQRLKLFSLQPAPQQSLNVQEISAALDEKRVEVSYQPMLQLKTQQVVCVEALACIRHPQDGLLEPSQFIPMAEKFGLIGPLTFAVIRTALKDLSSWSAANNDLQIAVNLSQNLLLDNGFIQRVKNLLTEADIQPQRLVFEIVERGDISDRGKLADSLTQLSDLGVCLSLNNFGSNITSLSHINEFPYQTLKLDKQFAMHALKDENAAAMIRSSLDLARSVGLSVVVEGIQTEDTLRWLGKLGCELGQGMFISPPIPAAKFNAWLARLKQQAGTFKFEPPVQELAACNA